MDPSHDLMSGRTPWGPGRHHSVLTPGATAALEVAASSSLTAASMTSTSVGLSPPPAKCPQMPGITRSSASRMWDTSHASSSGGK